MANPARLCDTAGKREAGMTETPETASVRGGCACGAVRFSYTGRPKWVAYCHCASCRRATAAPAAAWIGLETNQYTLEAGTPATYGSSPGVSRGFCGTCGTPLSYAGTRWPTEIHLLAGALDDPAGIAPRGHVHVDDQLPWFEVLDTLPRFAGVGGEAPPLRRGPRTSAD